MFSLCAAMEWNHLPVAGGIYDQDPELLRRWRIIFAEKHKHEEAERKREQARARSKGSARAR